MGVGRGILPDVTIILVYFDALESYCLFFFYLLVFVVWIGSDGCWEGNATRCDSNIL